MGPTERHSFKAEIGLTNAIDTWPLLKRTYFIALNYIHACDVGGRYVQMSEYNAHRGLRCWVS